jgi:hypothetical protein
MDLIGKADQWSDKGAPFDRFAIFESPVRSFSHWNRKLGAPA